MVVALGCSPELAIPTAFDIAALDIQDIGAYTRREMRDRIHGCRLLERCAKDIYRLLLPDTAEEHEPDVDVVGLWDGGIRVVESTSMTGFRRTTTALQLIRRPNSPRGDGPHPGHPRGGDPNPPERWSIASRRRRFGAGPPRKPVPQRSPGPEG